MRGVVSGERRVKECRSKKFGISEITGYVLMRKT
jgi:hypothetical protein